MGSIIASVGTYTPSRVLTNLDFERILALSGQTTTDEWITRRTGIQTRHVAESHETVGSMAYEASLHAIKRLTKEISPIEHIIVATNTHHRPFPNAAGEIQYRLRNSNSNFIDAHASGSDPYAGCTGINIAFMYSLPPVSLGCAFPENTNWMSLPIALSRSICSNINVACL